MRRDETRRDEKKKERKKEKGKKECEKKRKRSWDEEELGGKKKSEREGRTGLGRGGERGTKTRRGRALDGEGEEVGGGKGRKREEGIARRPGLSRGERTIM